MAVLIYAAYTSTNHYRKVGGTDQDTAVEHLKQQCRNAVMGHSASCKVVVGRWGGTICV